MATFQQKLNISMASAFMFAVLNLPAVYRLTNKLAPTFKNGCPTHLGVLLHTLVFFALSYMSMRKASVSRGIKIKHSLYGALIFSLLSSPMMYSQVGRLTGGRTANSAGCPTLQGVVLHAVVYCAVLVAVMYLPNKA